MVKQWWQTARENLQTTVIYKPNNLRFTKKYLGTNLKNDKLKGKWEFGAKICFQFHFFQL